MLLFIIYEEKRISLDIEDTQTVYAIKEKVREIYQIGPDEGPTTTETQDKKLLTLTYAGGDLKETWILCDLGIVPGSTLKVELREQINPSLYLFSVFNQETIKIFDKILFNEMPVDEFRAMASRKVGLPVSVFRLLAPDGTEMYDCNTLYTYSIYFGQTITVETWDGWNDFLNLAILGFSSHVSDQLSSIDVVARFQMKVALYIAAHFGHVDLAVTMLRGGIEGAEHIGYHPQRQWCQQTTQHIDSLKTAVHEAAEFGQLGVLRSLIHNNICNVLAKDGNDLTPLNIALRKQQKNCASFLLTKQWSKINYSKKHSVPLSIFVKLKRWSERAKMKTLVIHGQWKSSIKNPRRHIECESLVGYGVQLDGFSKSMMTSKSVDAIMEEQYEAKKKKRESVYDGHYELGVDPHDYFKSLGKMHAMRLPKINRFGKMLAKAAQIETVPNETNNSEEKENLTSVKVETATTDQDTKHVPRPRSNSMHTNSIRLPPLTSKLVGTSKSSSMQNLTSPAKEDDMPAQLSKAVFLRTGHRDSEASHTLSPIKFTSQSPSGNENAKIHAHETDQKPRKKRRNKLAKSDFLLAKAHGEGAIPLPMVSLDPAMHQRREECFGQILESYQRLRGSTSRDYAVKCLTVAKHFKEKPWLAQVSQATTIAARGVRKTVRNQPHLFNHVFSNGKRRGSDTVKLGVKTTSKESVATV